MSLRPPEQRLSFMLSSLSSSPQIGVLRANLNGVIEANEAFLGMVGCTRAELQAGKLDWIAMTPREHIARDARALDELRREGSCTPFEKDLILQDGSRLPILIAGVRTSQDPLEWVCWLLNRREPTNTFSAARFLQQLGGSIEKIA